ncbi:MAG: hypothetical protein AABM67_16795 [Acidobacteriota bacterium]
MRTTFLLIALLITIPGTTAAQDASRPKELVPLRFKNEALGPLTVKLVGRTRKTLRLAYNENLVVLVNPGEFQCFYLFKDEVSNKFISKKTEKFQVPIPSPYKPNDGFEVTFEDERAPGLFPGVAGHAVLSSLKEFNAADGNALAPAEIDKLRFSNLDVVVVLGRLIYGYGPDDAQDRKNAVLALFNQYFRGVLFPKLSRLGIKARYLGVRDTFDENTLTAPALVIHYKEDEGRPYVWGASTTTVLGVVIDCSLTLNYPGILRGQGIWGATLQEENDETLKGNILANPQELLHNQALRYLRAELNDLEFDLADWGPKKAPGAGVPRPPSRRQKN